MHFPFVSEKTGLHTDQIVLSGFLISFYISFQLKLLRFQKVTGVIFVRNGKRSDIHLHQTVDQVAFTTHRQHLQHAVLSTVVRVFGTSFALGNPDGLVLLINGIMHITGHPCRRFQHLPHGQRPLYNKRLVDTNQLLDPRINQQIVANRYLNRIHPLIDQQDRKEARIQYNIPMIGDICISLTLIRHSRMIQSQPIRMVRCYFP